MSEQSQLTIRKQSFCHFCDRSRFHILQLESSRLVRLCWYCSNYLRFIVLLIEPLMQCKAFVERFIPPSILGGDPCEPVIQCSLCDSWYTHEKPVFPGRHLNLCVGCLDKFWKEGRRI